MRIGSTRVIFIAFPRLSSLRRMTPSDFAGKMRAAEFEPDERPSDGCKRALLRHHDEIRRSPLTRSKGSCGVHRQWPESDPPTRTWLNIVSQLRAESPIAGNAIHSRPLLGGPIRRVFLAPETERFLRGAVGIAEQDAFTLGHNVIGRP